MTTNSRIYPSNTALLLFVAALFGSGFLLAVGNHACYQVPVENAQVLSGLISYPRDNPYYLYQVNVWSLVNQFCAVGLKYGLSEETLSILVSGAGGAFSFTALGLITLALSSNIWISILTPVMMYITNLVGFPSANYSIILMGGRHTHGTIGIFSGIIAIGLIGCRRIKTAAFIIGIGICLHLSLGIFYLISFCLYLTMVRKQLESNELKQILRALVGGIALSAISFAIHKFYYAVNLPIIDRETINALLRGFLQNFDFHRNSNTKELLSAANSVALFTSILCGLEFWREKKSGKMSLVAASILAVSLTTVMFVLADMIIPSDHFKIIMSWRFLNVLNVCFIPVVIGLLGRGDNYHSLVALIMLVIFPFLSSAADIDVQHFPLYILLVLITASVFLVKPVTMTPGLSRFKNGIAAVLLFLAAFHVIFPALNNVINKEYMAGIEDNYKNVPEINQIHKRPGLLLTTGGTTMVQICTRRPLLIGADGVSSHIYIPQTLPGVNEILSTFYGLNLLITPPEFSIASALVTETHRSLWESHRREEWLKITAKYGVTDILTPPDWKLQLPLVLSTENFSLFEVN